MYHLCENFAILAYYIITPWSDVFYNVHVAIIIIIIHTLMNNIKFYYKAWWSGTLFYTMCSYTNRRQVLALSTYSDSIVVL